MQLELELKYLTEHEEIERLENEVFKEAGMIQFDTNGYGNKESDEMIEHGRNYLRVTGEPPRVFDGTATLVYTPEFLAWVKRLEG